MTASPTTSQFFDINSDEAFFRSLQRAASNFRSQKVKDTASVLYLLMGVNHLRDWICPAPRPKKDQKPLTPEQDFYLAIHKLPEFVIVKELCNHSKHMGNTPYRLEATYGALISEYSNIGSVFSIASGPPIGYSVDRRDLFDIIEVALAFYQSEWYEKLQK